jgi:septum formation protein
VTPRIRLILASASPRRRELLRAIGVAFRVVPSCVDEIPREGESPAGFVRRAAREKGEEVASRHPDAYVLAADTIVVEGGEILGKPKDLREARGMLIRLSGREHEVHTAVFLSRKETGYRDGVCVTTRVVFRGLTAGEIDGYLRTGESADKAGAYAAQGAGNLLIDRISGSYSNVVGLPMTQTLALLLRSKLLRASRRGPGWYEFAEGRA